MKKFQNAYLRQLIAEYFNLSEIRDICFDLAIVYEDLQGESRRDRARELVDHCERHNHIDELITRCEQLRPSIDWRSSRLLDTYPLFSASSNLPPPSYSHFVKRETAFIDIIKCLNGIFSITRGGQNANKTLS